MAVPTCLLSAGSLWGSLSHEQGLPSTSAAPHSTPRGWPTQRRALPGVRASGAGSRPSHLRGLTWVVARPVVLGALTLAQAQHGCRALCKFRGRSSLEQATPGPEALSPRRPSWLRRWLLLPGTLGDLPGSPESLPPGQGSSPHTVDSFAQPLSWAHGLKTG